MNCPICNSKTVVIDSRNHKKGWKRRRECTECMTRFNTFEGLDVRSLPEYLRFKLEG